MIDMDQENKQQETKQKMIKKIEEEKFRSFVSVILLSLGFLWLFTFNRKFHVLIKYFSHQGYIITWVYFLAEAFSWKKVLQYKTEHLFELSLVLQTMITPAYWILIHGPSINSGKLSMSNIYWNMYIHTIPLILLLWSFLSQPTISEPILQKYNNMEIPTRPRLTNNWTHTLFFYVVIAVPINIYYSFAHRPVYPFLKYKGFLDLVVLIIGGLLLFALHEMVYYTLTWWSTKQHKKKEKN